MPETTTTFAISDLAREFGITPRTIRFYEDQGLLNPAREGQTRIYSKQDRVRLKLTLRGKRLGFPLNQIRTIIDLYDAPRGKRSQLQYVLAQIDDRRTDLEQRRRDLDDALTELDRFEDRCREDLARIT